MVCRPEHSQSYRFRRRRNDTCSAGQKEVDTLFERMGVAEPKYKMEVKAGDVVRINDGPFKDFEGAINAIDEEKGKIKILISMFGRETPVEIDYLQVKKI